MRNVVALGLAVGLGLSSISAQAIPFSPQPIIGNSMVSEAKFGCGPGGTRGPYGHCRRRFTCPPGWHTGPHGWHCTRNW
jgi:hypothetical protein